MAWIFSLSAECGSDESNAKEFAQYFTAKPCMFSNPWPYCADTFQDSEKNWWCRVYLNHLSKVGINNTESAFSMTELGLTLYRNLLSSPPFRYALVGVEVDEFRTYSELIEDLPNLSIPGLVLAKTIEQEVETLPIFRAFGSSYVWQPYEGEVYNPLMVSPELKNKLDELLAVS